MEEKRDPPHHEHHDAHHVMHHTNAKKISWLKVGIAAGILIAVVLGVIWIINISNAKGISEGDTVLFKYDLTFSDGTKISNSSEFKVGSISESFGFASTKLDDALKNVSLGKKETIILSASDAFGDYDPENIMIENRTFIVGNRSIREINRTFETTPSIFKQVFNVDPTLNQEYPSNQMTIWKTKVVGLSNGSVKMSIENKAGENLSVDQSMFVSIVEVTSDKIRLRVDAEEKTVKSESGNFTTSIRGNDIYQTWTPNIGQDIPYGYSMVKVLSYNETSVVLDANNPYAGKNLTITIEAVKVVKSTASAKPSSPSTASNVKKVEGAPNIELFVMSYCPFGIQNEKGIIPAIKLLRDKVNFEVKFVYYAMHGQKELDENTRQYCIQKEQNEKYLNYLECFLESGESAGCLGTSNIDETKMKDCVSAADDEFDITKNYNDQSTWLNGRYPLYNVYKDDNDKYQVGGSPTLIINGQEAQSARDPESLKNAICDAFASKPSECSETLSTETPTPEFGTGTQASGGSSGGCGG